MRKYLYSVQKKKKQPKTIFSIISTNVFKCCKDLELILLIFFFLALPSFQITIIMRIFIFMVRKKVPSFVVKKYEW